MRKLLLFLVLPALLAAPAAASAGELKLTIQNGLVTLIAEDVPLSAIMAEWARVGQTKIVNGDKILTPVSVQIIETPERKALDILLRKASGYMAAERPVPVANASMFDRIMILPTSQAPANAGPISSPAPYFQPRAAPVQPPPDDDVDPVVPPGLVPQPPGANQPGQNAAVPNAPLTAPRPGMLPQPPPQLPVPFGAPPKPAGGGGGAPVYEPDRDSN
jgi:hypothetical protein